MEKINNNQEWIFLLVFVCECVVGCGLCSHATQGSQNSLSLKSCAKEATWEKYIFTQRFRPQEAPIMIWSRLGLWQKLMVRLY